MSLTMSTNLSVFISIPSMLSGHVSIHQEAHDAVTRHTRRVQRLLKASYFYVLTETIRSGQSQREEIDRGRYRSDRDPLTSLAAARARRCSTPSTMENRNVAPMPTSDSTQIFPPRRSTIRRHRASPIPVPG